MIVFVSVLSFLLDGIISKYITSNTLFIPLLTLMSLIVIYPYFKESYKYFRYCAILGFLYDIAYMNTIFYAFFIFILIGFIISYFYYLFSNTLFITILISLFVICFYRIINALFFITFKSANIDFTMFIKSIYSSIILNVVFCVLAYILTNKYSKKHHILRIN
jgi:rod shape-determining protein MreD